MQYYKKILVFILFLSPLIGYFSVFHHGFSQSSSDWANFGSYVGGVYGALGFFAVAFSLYLNGRQNLKLEQDQVFYKSMELLSNRVSSSSVLIDGTTYQGSGILKKIVNVIRVENEKQSIYHARQLLCETPELISDLHYSKIMEAVHGFEDFYSRREELISEIKNALLGIDDFNGRWELLKNYIGSRDHETPQVLDALGAIGHVWFYKIPVSERKEIYKAAVSTLEYEFGEFINGYNKSFAYISQFVSSAVNRDLYQKFVLSQVSKYEVIILFHYAMITEDQGVINSMLELGILEEILSPECRSLLFDLPSVEEIEQDVRSLKM
ncbi:hypothetical protein [Photobacterium swingsii]|uniref:hypothetical protein n=1 Tax=Photobacterium swingsii TaxID=680026 RepID=UPI004067DA46